MCVEVHHYGIAGKGRVLDGHTASPQVTGKVADVLTGAGGEVGHGQTTGYDSGMRGWEKENEPHLGCVNMSATQTPRSVRAKLKIKIL